MLYANTLRSVPFHSHPSNQQGAVLVLVLILLAVIARFGVTGMTQAVSQLHIARNHWAANQSEHAVDQAHYCMMNQLSEPGADQWLRQAQHAMTVTDDPQWYEKIKGLATPSAGGCGAVNEAGASAMIKGYRFNHKSAIGVVEYCGEQLDAALGSDIDVQRSHRYRLIVLNETARPGNKPELIEQNIHWVDVEQAHELPWVPVDELSGRPMGDAVRCEVNVGTLL